MVVVIKKMLTFREKELIKSLVEIRALREKNKLYAEQLRNAITMLKDVITIIKENELLTEEERKDLIEKLKRIIEHFSFILNFYASYHLI
jgi:hypothetical protein